MLLNERSPSEDYIVYNSNYLTFLKRQNYRDSKKIRSCQGFGRKGEFVEHRDFRAEKLFSDTIMAVTCLYTFIHLSEFIKCKTYYPYVNYGLGVIKMCQSFEG